MKNYSEPIIELLALSPTDIIQNSPPVNLTGNDPYMDDPGWLRS